VNFYIPSLSNHGVGRGDESNRRRLNSDYFETVCLAGGVLFPSARIGVRQRVAIVFLEKSFNAVRWLLLLWSFCRFAA
jgi:hypothetical protein